jgi:hypothetical protein
MTEKVNKITLQIIDSPHDRNVNANPPKMIATFSELAAADADTAAPSPIPAAGSPTNHPTHLPLRPMSWRRLVSTAK